MRLVRLEIRNFRCFSSLDWVPQDEFVVLVGAGDSGKSTILDAIEMTLSPRWAVGISETDFYDGDLGNSIEITCFVGSLEAELISDRRFGLELQGISPAGAVHDEPEAGDTPALAIRFSADSTYEPIWRVVNERLPDGGRPISSADRRQLGLTRLGGSPDRHLGWGQGSALGRLTAEDAGYSGHIADAARAMRTAIREMPLDGLTAALGLAGEAARRFGVGGATDDLTAQLSADAVDSRLPSLALHNGDVPMARAGLGTRRLLALAIQNQSVGAGGLALIDEVEAGLEPFRLRHLIRVLTDSVGTEHGQAILTTHSSNVVEEVNARNLVVVKRSTDTGVGSVLQVPAEIQALVRSNSESLFARKIVVCEGKTEVGLLRGLGVAWEARNDCPPSHRGTVYADGGGSQTQERALSLSQLGFDCLVLADSDVEIDPGDKLKNAGVKVVRWGDQMAVDERLFQDLPLLAFHQLLDIVIAESEAESVVAQVKSRLTGAIGDDVCSVHTLLSVPELELRAALGSTAKAKSWFKRIDLGELAGIVVGEYLGSIPATDLAKNLSSVESWIYD